MAIAFHVSWEQNIVVAFANFAVLSRPLRKTIAIVFEICGRYIVFALASARLCHGCGCESVEIIAIAQAMCGSHCGCFLWSHGIVVITFAISSRFIVALLHAYNTVANASAIC